MPARRRGTESTRSSRRPATTPEARETQLVSEAMDLAESQIQAGTASSQVITHFLKLGSSREQLEQIKIAHDNELTRVKIEALESQQRVEELYREAMQAMRSYTGETPIPESQDED